MMDSKMDNMAHRPLVPKKPDKDKISSSTASPPPSIASSGSEALLIATKKSSSIDSSFRSPNSTAQARASYFNGGQPETSPSVPPPLPPTKNLTPTGPSSTKPALPPKPNCSSPRHSISSPPSSLSSPPTNPPTKTSPPSLLPKGRNSLSIANAILANANKNGESSSTTTTKPSQNANPSPQQTFTESNLTRRGIRSPSAPLSPRPPSSNFTNSQPPRPFSSAFNFPIQHQEQSPTCQNLTQNQSPPQSRLGNSSFPPPGKSLRGKSASLGRNFTPPTSPTSSVGQFFTNKAATLARMLPLDLSFGKSPTVPNPKPNTKPANSIPTLIQNFNNHISSQQHQNINFSKNNNLSSGPPPPPPPRLRRKLSPIGSLSPVSDTSPNSPPPPSGFTPPCRTMSEDRGNVIYAEIDKEKKWAARRLKEESETISVEKVENNEEGEDGIQGSLVITINRDSSHCKLVNVQSVPCSEVLNRIENSEEKVVVKTSQTGNKPAEAIVVDSWLGKFLTAPVTGEGQQGHKTQDDNSIPLTPVPDEECAKYEIESNFIPVDDLTQSDTIKTTATINHESVTLSDNRSFLFSHLSTVGGGDDEKDKNVTQPPVTASNPAITKDEDVNFEEESASAPTTTTTTDSLLQSVDSKIQSVVNRLSNLTGKVSPSSQRSDSPSPAPHPPITEEFLSLSITEGGETTPGVNPVPENNGNLLTTSTTSPTIRRRSWNCSQDSSPCDSSSSSSLTNLKSPSSKKVHLAGSWVDEGDSTGGGLGDIDTSDAPPTLNNNSSLEDIGSTLSLRRRTMKLFSSFGKSGSSSGSSSSGTVQKKRQSDKKKSLVESNGKGVRGMSRQISGPILSPPPYQIQESLPPDSKPQLTREKSRSHPTVQFSPDVITTTTHQQTPPHHPHHHRLSEGSIGSPGTSPPGRNSLQMPESEQGDDESISSFGSLSTISTGYNLNLSNSAGYEDILAELSPSDKKAFYVAREILTSEQTFIDVLDLLTIDFPNAVRRYEEGIRNPIIPPQDLEMILAGLPTLKRVNEELQTDLQARVSNWLAVPKLADVIVKKGPFLKLYAHYIKNFEKTTAKLDECCGLYPPFKAALLEFEQSERCHKLGLKHFMLKPVQRMPQYRLLLSDYLKHQEEGGCDYEDTVKALAIVKDVADHANEAIKLQVNADKLLHLQNRMTGAIIMKSDRQLLKEGELIKVCRKDLQPRFFALMNDCLMCMSYNYNVGASGGGGSSKDLKMRHELPLTGMRICLSASEDYQNEFSVISTTRSFNLVAKSAKERELWMKALNDAVNGNIRKRTCRTPDQEEGFALGKIAPVWIQDSRVTMCQICTAEFTVTFRRHHCRSCGKVVCRHCSGNEAPLQYRKNDAERVCDECYQYLLEEFDKESAYDGLETSRETIRARFKKVTPNISNRRKRNGKSGILEVPANNSGSRISGYLHCRERKAWKRRWFVLMDRVLYIYAASEDIVAIKSFPVLGWNVDYEKTECMDGGDSEAVFKLTHLGQNTLLFQADNPALAERWVNLMKEATVLT